MSTPPQGEGWRPGDPHGSGPPWQQGPWLHPPGPPPPTGNGLKWLLGAVAMLLVIAIAVGITVIVMSRDEDSEPAASPTVASDIASAADIGPVAIVTEEPTCEKYLLISNSLSDVESKWWGDRRALLAPASEWTSEQRSQVDEVARAMRNAAEQSIALAEQTPHRLVRELYEQFIAYGRAYADRIANYIPRDNGLASANVNAGSALVGICNTITYGAATRSLAVEAAAPPTIESVPKDVSHPERFVISPNTVCQSWISRLDTFTAATPEWQNRDTGMAAANWSSEQRAIERSARPLLSSFADGIERDGRASANPTLEDFATAAALYTRASLATGDNYNGAADGWLSYVAFRIANLVSGACRAIDG